MVQKVCKTCKLALRFTSPPSPGGPLDGVDCTSPRLAGYLDELGSSNYIDELKEHGSFNIWRIESVAVGEECEFWQPREELKCPGCGGPLLILATHEYRIYFEDGKYHKDVGTVEYACNTCRVPLSPDKIKKALAEVDEL